MKMNIMLEDYVSHLLSKNSNMSSAVGIFPPASRGWGNHLHRHLPSPPEESMGEAKAYNLKLGSPTGGALAGQASPPALSPNLPNIVKMEPRLPSPCSGDSYSPTKKTKMEDGTWIPSPSQMSIDSSVSPPPLNGHSPHLHPMTPIAAPKSESTPNAKVDPLVLLWLNQTREDDLDKSPGQRVKRRRRADRSDIDIKKIVKDLLTPAVSTTSGVGSASTGRKRSVGDESSPEVSSSNISPEPNPVVTTTGISPVPSLAPSDIGEVDLEFWDLDINESSNANTIASTSDKDELSPPNSVMNGCYDYDKKKKGPTPRQQEELCLVCGDRASGYHYNALTCEGCKGFFRRSITKNAVYQCKYGNNCEIDMYMRRKCQECRLKKCLSVGMRPECVVPEYQCAIKRETKKAQKDKDKPNSTTRDSGSDKEEKPLGSPAINNGIQSKTLSKNQEDLISRLVVFQEEYESPSEDDFRKITAFPLGDSEEDSLKRFQHITEITILTVQLIVEFSKRVPGFDSISREDQITLLKACSSEVMMLRTARKYDMKTDSIVFANNQPYTRENYRSACMGDSADSIFHFCRTMCVLKVDNAEYALLTAIVIFSERPCLLEPRKVEKIQEFYLECLAAYIATNRPPGKNYFAKLLATLVELRTLGNMNSELCFSLKVQNKKLPPFLEEIWDIQQ